MGGSLSIQIELELGRRQMARQLAIDRAKQLFNADYVNVQPHSGSNANSQAFMALVTALG